MAQEKPTEIDGLVFSRESVRQLMIAEEIWKLKHCKAPAAHPMSECRGCSGELVQIDGSEHVWVEARGPIYSLLVFVDDATSQLLEL